MSTSPSLESVPKLGGIRFGGGGSPPPEARETAPINKARSGEFEPATVSFVDQDVDERDEEDIINHLSSIRLSDREQRNSFARRIPEISQAAGPATLRKELLPMYVQLCNFDDSSIIVAQSLPDIVGNGGGLKHIQAFLPLMETLMTNIDPGVSAETVDSIRLLIFKDEDEDEFNALSSHVVPMVIRLGASRWCSARASAGMLLADVYRVSVRSPETRETVMKLFESLCEDSYIGVRKAAVSTLARWATSLTLHEYGNYLHRFVKQFADELYLDGIRIELVGQIVEICRVLPGHEAELRILPILHALVNDRSWRVRYVMAKHVGSFVSTFQTKSDQLLASVVNLGEDEEVEVRSVTAAQLEVVCAALPTKVVEEHFAPVAAALAVDDALTVKSAIACTICQIAACCSKQVAETKLFPSILKLLHDKAERVRCNLLEHISSLANVFADKKTVLDQLIQELLQSVDSPRWRVRESVAIALRQFAIHLSPKAVEALQPCIEKLLNDDVNAVRNAAVGTVAAISPHFGSQWSSKLLETLSKSFAGHGSYIKRSLFLLCMEGLFPRVEEKDVSESFKRELVAIITSLAGDKVRNVRQTAAKVLTTISLAKTTVLTAERNVCINLLRSDQDPDVKAAAEVRQWAEAPF